MSTCQIRINPSRQTLSGPEKKCWERLCPQCARSQFFLVGSSEMTERATDYLDYDSLSTPLFFLPSPEQTLAPLQQLYQGTKETEKLEVGREVKDFFVPPRGWMLRGMRRGRGRRVGDRRKIPLLQRFRRPEPRGENLGTKEQKALPGVFPRP